MQTQLEILEQEEQEALEALQKSQNPPEENEQTEETEKVVPLTEVLKEENEQDKSKETEPEKKQEDKPKTEAEPKKSEEKFDFENEFETYGYKLNPDKKTDPRYLAGKFFSTAGLLKKVSGEKKQADEKYKNDLKEQQSKIAEMQKTIENLKKSSPSEPVEQVSTLDDFEARYGEYEFDRKVFDNLKEDIGESKKIKELQGEIENLKTLFETDKKSSLKDKFWDDVYSKAPEAKTIPNDIFDVWLEQPQYANATYRNAYEDALYRGDTGTVAKLLSDCLKDINKGNEKTDTIPDNIQAQVSAKPIQQSSSGGMQGKPIFTQDQIKDFEDKVRFGEIAPQEAKRINLQIDEALIEGRVR